MTHPARRLWRLLEPLHAVSYFAPEAREALAEVGLRGFWMGYFAGRAAPFGPCGPGLVEATFYNFDRAMVRRAIPDAWKFAAPTAVLAARSTAAAEVLRRVVPGIDAEAERIVPLLSSAVRSGRPDGRPLFAANQALPLPEDPVAGLWQCATSLREHRGDGHVAALVAADVSGIEAHLLLVAARIVPDDRQREARGFDSATWAAAREGLVERGWLAEDGSLSAQGARERDRIEALTDDLALQPYRDGLTGAGLDLLPGLLRPLARRVADADVLPFPNPIGLERDVD